MADTMNEQRLLNVLLVLLAILCLTGCASIERTLGPGWEDRAEQDPEQKFTLSETAWHGLNVVDTLQTLHIANSPECYSESNPLTRSLIGEHPSKGEVIAVGVAYSLVHHLTATWLERKAREHGTQSGWHDVRNGWHIFMLMTKGFSVGRNHAMGLRPDGHGC